MHKWEPVQMERPVPVCLVVQACPGKQGLESWASCTLQVPSGPLHLSPVPLAHGHSAQCLQGYSAEVGAERELGLWAQA